MQWFHAAAGVDYAAQLLRAGSVCDRLVDGVLRVFGDARGSVGPSLLARPHSINLLGERKPSNVCEIAVFEEAGVVSCEGCVRLAGVPAQRA